MFECPRFIISSKMQLILKIATGVQAQENKILVDVLKQPVLLNSFNHSKAESICDILDPRALLQMRSVLELRWRDTMCITHAQAMYFLYWTVLDITALLLIPVDKVSKN